MRAFVTGGNGFVGCHLVAHLEACGDHVTAPFAEVTNPARLAEALASVPDGPPDVIYHLAGQADVGRSWTDVSLTWSVNTMGTVNLLEAARELAPLARIIVISSAEVYGSVPEAELPITEARLPLASSPYGASKIAAELAAEFAHRSKGQRVIIARPFNHLGVGQSPGFILPAVARQISLAERTGDTVLRLGNLDARRDMTSVTDVVRAYRLMAERGHDGAVYNVCSDVTLSMRELVDRMIAMSRVPLTVELDTERLRPSDIAVQCGSSARLRADTGWKPVAELDDVIRGVLDEWRAKAPVG
jgi:GDP-4-dehydro-6-deoxy-D-mannose reductase